MTTITYQQMNDLAGGGLTEQQMDGIAQYFGYTITPAKPPEAMVKDDVERVARALCAASFHPDDAAISWQKAREWGDRDKWMKQARAAMAATLELAAEDLRNAGDDVAWSRVRAADWLQQRAKEAGNG